METPIISPRRFISLRVKTIILLLPFAVGVVTITGYLSILSARVALTRAATRILAYKAEQIRDFTHSQWEILVDLGLEDDILYVQTAKSAIQSYATSTLRNETELVFAVDQFGRVELATDQIETTDLDMFASAAVREGWIEFESEDGPRVGQVFQFDPFGWTVYTTDRRDAFFAEIGAMTRTMVITAFVTAVAGVLISLWFSTLVGRPVEAVTTAMREIQRSGDVGKLVPILSHDEIGVLAKEFNDMNRTLAETHHALADRVESERVAKQQTLEREYESLIVLAKATEYKDHETGQHLYRVGEMSRMLGELIGLSETQQDLLLRAGPLHDVGKIGIPDRVLLKPGPLDADERRQMETHAEIGYRILSQTRSRYLRIGAHIAHTHHEKWDGSGYPNRLREAAIPLFGRIVGIIDVLDALTSKRPYKEAWPIDDAIAEIERCSGTHFDPQLATMLVSNRTMFSDLIVRTRDQT